MDSNSNLYEERGWLEQLSAGSEAAFTAIYNQYWQQLFFLAHTRLRSAAVAEEIVQEVFLTLWKKRSALTIHSLPLYLAAMTRYAVYRYLADEKRRGVMNTGTLPEPSAGGDADLDNKLLLEIIEKLAARLPERCRLVFIHNKLLDQPLQQVAGELNISLKTAETHLTKALKLIREHLGDSLHILFL